MRHLVINWNSAGTSVNDLMYFHEYLNVFQLETFLVTELKTEPQPKATIATSTHLWGSANCNEQIRTKTNQNEPKTPHCPGEKTVVFAAVPWNIQNIRCAYTYSGDLCDEQRFFFEPERTATNYNDHCDLCHESRFVVVRQKSWQCDLGLNNVIMNTCQMKDCLNALWITFC